MKKKTIYYGRNYKINGETEIASPFLFLIQARQNGDIGADPMEDPSGLFLYVRYKEDISKYSIIVGFTKKFPRKPTAFRRGMNWENYFFF